MEMIRLMRNAGRTGVVILLGLALLGCGASGFAQDTKQDGKSDPQARPVFAEGDAVLVLDQMQQALEAGSPGKFLRLFDTRRMPGYAAFRDQVEEFFETYNSIRMNYHLTQVAMDGGFGGAMTTLTLEAARSEAGTPGIRRSVQARLLLAWDGKNWKIADLAPREMFRTGS